MFRTSGEAAFETAMKNSRSKWPRSNDKDNRLRPLSSPEFIPSFKFDPGESIFTIGSCFARNVEWALREKGFRVPCAEFIVPEEEAWGVGQESSSLNKYSPFSMLNELQFATEAAEAKAPEAYLVESLPGLYSDYQLHVRGVATLERALERRNQVKQAYRDGLRDSRIVIITLGMAEAWFDSHAGVYLNDAPTLNMVKKYSGRFFFEVLTYEQLLSCIRETMNLLRQYRGEDLKVLLTVSPVPLNRSFSGQDVITANMYSKSVLRAIAEIASRENDFVDYFPSYESIMHSSPEITWAEDQAHITMPAIRHNVSRMIEAYSRPVTASG